MQPQGKSLRRCVLRFVVPATFMATLMLAMPTLAPNQPALSGAESAAKAAGDLRPAAASQPSLLSKLDAPLLFVKRHPYMAAHIYDDYYTWHPGGGIYVIENPSAPPEKRKIRAIIDPNTKETLGVGVYRDPDISWDGKRVLFAFKGEAAGNTSLYEIGIDGRGLRRLTDAECDCKGPLPERLNGAGHHDITPC